MKFQMLEAHIFCKLDQRRKDLRTQVDLAIKKINDMQITDEAKREKKKALVELAETKLSELTQELDSRVTESVDRKFFKMRNKIT